MYVLSKSGTITKQKRYMLLFVTVEGYMEQQWEGHYCGDTCKE
jgi:hypothetical protein